MKRSTETMCALLRELIVPIADLHRLAVECGNCKAVTVLDFTTRIQRQGGPVAPALVQSPVCDRAFDAGLKDRIHALAGILEWMEALPEERISFRVPPPA
jgi:hypothetical protein